MLPGILFAYRESGLRSVYSTGRDAWFIILARTCRMFAYGGSALVLALFFAELHLEDARIGLFMTLTLAGDVVLSFYLAFAADRIGRRNTISIGSVMMIVSGIIFGLFENFWILLFAAVVGVMSATGGDFGPFRSIEESMLAELTDPSTRSDVLSWYITSATLGFASGTELAGRLVESLSARDGWTLLDAYHATFGLYSIMGLVNLGISLLLSKRCELLGKDTKAGGGYQLVDGRPDAELDADVDAGAEPAHDDSKQQTKRFSRISKETRSIMYILWFLLMVDSVADGMTSMSLTTYFIHRKFSPPKSTLGDIISSGHFLAACAAIFAGPLSRHIGLVNTMVFTHVPSSAAVALFPFAGGLGLTIALFLLRMGLNNMDQAPRSALISAVVKADERTAVMGITTMLRTLAATTGPSITGLLAGNDKFWIAFVVAGSLRLAYDFGLWATFINVSLYKHEEHATSDSEELQSIEGDKRDSSSSESAR